MDIDIHFKAKFLENPMVVCRSMQIIEEIAKKKLELDEEFEFPDYSQQLARALVIFYDDIVGEKFKAKFVLNEYAKSLDPESNIYVVAQINDETKTIENIYTESRL